MNNKKGIILTGISSVVFGFAFTLGPMTYGAGGSNALTLSFLRNVIALPFLAVMLKMAGASFRVTKKQLVSLVLLGAIANAVYTLLLNMSYVYIDVGVSTMITFVYPVLVMLACVLLFHEKITKSKIIALTVAMAGIFCFFIGAQTGASKGQNPGLGITLTLLSAVFYAGYLVAMDKTGLNKESPFKITFYVALFSSISLGTFGKINGQLTLGTLTGRSWMITVIFALLCSVVALPLIQLGIRHIGATEASVVSTLEPIMCLVFSALMLGEKITLLKALASILIVCAVLYLTFSEKNDGKDVG